MSRKHLVVLLLAGFLFGPIKAIIQTKQANQNVQHVKAMAVLGELHKQNITVTSLPEKNVGGQLRYQNGKPFIVVSSSLQPGYENEQNKIMVHEAVHALTRNHPTMVPDANGALPIRTQVMAQVYEKRNPQPFSIYKNAKPGTTYGYGDYNKMVRPMEAVARYGADLFSGNVPNNKRIPVFDQILNDSNLGMLTGQKKKTGLFK